MSFERIAFTSARTPGAESAIEALTNRYGNTPVDEADVVVALGGDGFMLQAMHNFMHRDIPIYGMNRGTIGFLMNQYSEDDLLERLDGATMAQIHPLRMVAIPESGGRQETLAINEVSLLRQTRQAAKIRIEIDGRVRMEELICDPAADRRGPGHDPDQRLSSASLAWCPAAAWRAGDLPRAGGIQAPRQCRGRHFRGAQRERGAGE